MSVFSKYKHNYSQDWGIDTEDFPFEKCSDMPLDKKIPFFGMFITPDSGYGEGAILILKKSLLSLPQRYVADIKNMLCDDAVVEAVKAKKCSIIVTEFTSKKYKKTGYDIEFCDN